jgi:hypothetical protein
MMLLVADLVRKDKVCDKIHKKGSIKITVR